MKTLTYILLFTFSSTFVLAQTGEITIDQDEKIEALLEIYKSAGSSGYYTIQVGFVSSNQKANDLRSLVNIDFPNLSSRVDFDSPTYRVKVGRFKTKLEGERKLQEVRRKYPAAMLLKPKK
ncbi:SPOR domain-containing protein [Maribacter algarum]|uniref:SPOR domain-containing protein n=1 Tax=Maribacter algarum (ex Zhang et al. 2020) TaxID=2578118 RepID=A0A5S3PYB1_9FLAO|nr:SPOR domain-containing protein [Maribacter algarum]TMM58287.1 SPOR domain-containing protein [Maribacter algarum]